MPKDYKDLVEAMPDIARVVNEFSSDAAQQTALAALLAAFNSESGAKSKAKASLGAEANDDKRTDADAEDPLNPSKDAARKTAAKRAVRSSSGGRRTLNNGSMLRDLDLHPKDLESFSDFCTRAKPQNQMEQVLVAAYWLTHIAGLATANIDQVFTCFRSKEWALPADLANKISSAGSKGWLKDSKRDLITLGNSGLNHVEHTMLKRPPETV